MTPNKRIKLTRIAGSTCKLLRVLLVALVLSPTQRTNQMHGIARYDRR